MADLADLGLRVTVQGGDQAVRTLDDLATSAGKTERSSASLAAGQSRLAEQIRMAEAALKPLRAAMVGSTGDGGRLADAFRQAERASDALATSHRRTRLASDDLAGSAFRAASATEELAAATLRAEAEMLDLHRAQAAVTASTRQLGDAAKATAVDLASMYDAHQLDFASQYAAGMNRVAGSTKLASWEMLYFGRQFSDVATMLAMGASPLMVVTTQAGQIADGFAMVSGRGVTVTQVLRQMMTSAVALAAALAPFALTVGAVAGAFLLWRKQTDDARAAIEATAKAQADFADVQATATDVLGRAVDFTEKYGVANDNVAAALDQVILSQNAAYAETLNGISAMDQASQAAVRRAETERLATVAILRRAAAEAEARASEAQKAANKDSGTARLDAVLSLPWRLNPEMPGSEDALTMMEQERARREAALGVDEKRRIAAEERGLAQALTAQAEALMKVDIAAAAASKAVQSYGGAATGAVRSSQAAATAIDEQAAAYAQLVEDLKTPAEKEIELLHSRMVTLRNEFDLGHISVETYREQFDRLWKPQPQLVRLTTEEVVTMHEEVLRLPTAWEQAEAAARDVLDVTRSMQWAVDDFARGIEQRDWVGAFGGLMRAIEQVKEAFGEAGTAADKVGAIAGIANAAGQAIGGKAGSVLSGAAGGAAAGFTIGGPIGAAIGAGLGGLAGLLGFDSQKKAQKQQQEAADIANALAIAQQRANTQASLELELLRLSGDETAYLAKVREQELAALDRTSAAIQRAIYALQDWETAVSKAQAALAKAEADLRASYDAEMAKLQKVIDEADVTGKRQQLEQAYQRERSALEATIQGVETLIDSLQGFRRELDLNPFAAMDPARNRAVAQGRFMNAAPEDLVGAGRTFIDASMASARTLTEFLRDRAAVANAIDQAASAAEAQLTEAERQIKLLEAQVSGLIAVNDNLLSVEEAIDQLLKAEEMAKIATDQQEILKAQFNALLKIDSSILSWADAVNNFAAATQALADAQAAKPDATPQGPTYEAVGWEGYVDRNSDLAALYASGSGMARGRSKVEFGQYHWERYGQAEDRYFRPFALGGAFTNGVVNGPMAFNMGVMGEAGPEAIMPLARTSGGQLGVVAANDGLKEEIRALRQEIAGLRASAEETARNTRDAKDVLEGSARGQLTLSTEAA